MNDAQQWFLIAMFWVTSGFVAIAQLTDWYERPPLSWLLAVHYWLADHLVRPWLEPLMRRLR